VSTSFKQELEMVDELNGQRIELVLPTGRYGRTTKGDHVGVGGRLRRGATGKAGNVGSPVPNETRRPFLSTVAGRATVVVGAVVAVGTLAAGLVVRDSVVAPEPIGIDETASGSGGPIVRIEDHGVRSLADDGPTVADGQTAGGSTDAADPDAGATGDAATAAGSGSTGGSTTTGGATEGGPTATGPAAPAGPTAPTGRPPTTTRPPATTTPPAPSPTTTLLGPLQVPTVSVPTVSLPPVSVPTVDAPLLPPIEVPVIEVPPIELPPISIPPISLPPIFG
jgi:hypothetical protein